MITGHLLDNFLPTQIRKSGPWQCQTTMPSSCCVPNCNSRYSKAKKVKLYHFPSNPEQRLAWIRTVRQEKWLPIDTQGFASSILYQESLAILNMMKTIYLLYSTLAKLGKLNQTWIASKLARYNRLQKRRKQKEHQSAPPLGSETTTSFELCDLQENVQTIDSVPSVNLDLHNSKQELGLEEHQELGLEEQQDSAQCVRGGSSECQILISDVDLEATRDEPILLFFSPIFLSGNSFIFNLCS